MLKDMGLATENAQALDARVPMAKLAEQLYEAHSKAGNGQLISQAYLTLNKTIQFRKRQEACPVVYSSDQSRGRLRSDVD